MRSIDQHRPTPSKSQPILLPGLCKSTTPPTTAYPIQETAHQPSGVNSAATTCPVRVTMTNARIRPCRESFLGLAIGVGAGCINS